MFKIFKKKSTLSISHSNDTLVDVDDTFEHLHLPKYSKKLNPNIHPIHPNLNPRDFKKIKLIGKGDVGKVYLVQDPMGKYYAMKILNKQDMITRNKIKRVFAEQQVLMNAQHPFIVSLHYTFQTEFHLYFITDFCAGGIPHLNYF
jgi:serine/threonine protein kinase